MNDPRAAAELLHVLRGAFARLDSGRMRAGDYTEIDAQIAALRARLVQLERRRAEMVDELAGQDRLL